MCSDICIWDAGNDSAEVASPAQQLLEHSLLSELHAVVARALSGLEMFASNQLSESDLYGSYGQEDDMAQSKAGCCSQLSLPPFPVGIPVSA